MATILSDTSTAVNVGRDESCPLTLLRAGEDDQACSGEDATDAEMFADAGAETKGTQFQK